jgi:hypothetical protein
MVLSHMVVNMASLVGDSEATSRNVVAIFQVRLVACLGLPSLAE